MERNWRSYAIEAFVPVVFILVMEYYLFFYVTMHDIEHAKEIEVKRIRTNLRTKLDRMVPKKRHAVEAYLANVHKQVEDDYQGSIQRRKSYRRRMEIKNVVFVFLTALMVGYFTYRWRHHVEFSVLAIQAFVHTVLIGVFQVFFYYHVGTKYQYSR